MPVRGLWETLACVLCAGIALFALAPAAPPRTDGSPAQAQRRPQGRATTRTLAASVRSVSHKAAHAVSTAKALPSPQHGGSSAALAALERASRADDAGALLSLARAERSPVRYEALRRALARGGPRLLDALRDAFEDPDPILHALLGDAFAAGGRADDAEALAALLPRLAPSARRAAAGAVLAIAARTEVSLSSFLSARDVLLLDARGKDPAGAEEALDALSRGGERIHEALASLAWDRGLDPGIRLLACEELLARGDAAARAPLEALACDDPDGPAGTLARAHLDRP
ncbi:MAG: hypothetical protein D6731_09230 [Planctomycetota bacterium]|nr:MAG: hypothetical protein D6731_09230 [Planctomycetota bacterium]